MLGWFSAAMACAHVRTVRRTVQRGNFYGGSRRVSRAVYTSPYSWAVSQGKSSFCRGKRKPPPTARGKGGAALGAAPNQEVFFLTGLSRNKRLCFWPALSPARAQRVAVCPRLAPGGGNGKGGESNSLLPQANSAGSLAPVNDGKMEKIWNAHRLRYESTSPTGATVRHGLSSGDGALWSDIAYSDVVRAWIAQDSTIGLAQD
jgi:hypothetical protein